MKFTKLFAVRGLVLALALAALIAVGSGSTAYASGGGQTCTPWSAGNAGVMHQQCTFHDATAVMPGNSIPCGPYANTPATLTLTYNGQLHFTLFTSGKGAGDFWATGTQTGTFLAVPDALGAPTYTGHFTTWFGDNNNLHNGSSTSTFTVHATGSDGSSFTFHDVTHVSTSATGMVQSFDKPTCN